MVNVIKIPVDIVENEDEYMIFADIPGVEKENIEISGNENSITIKALRYEKYKGKYLVMERTKGLMSRVIKFSKMININKAKAHYEDGVLTILLPKAKDEFIIDSYFKIVIF